MIQITISKKPNHVKKTYLWKTGDDILWFGKKQVIPPMQLAQMKDGLNCIVHLNPRVWNI